MVINLFLLCTLFKLTIYTLTNLFVQAVDFIAINL